MPTLSADVTEALVALWTDYAGVIPTEAHTEIDGNTVTCVLADGVSEFNIATDTTLDGYKPHGVAMTLANYKREAVSEVTRVTHQRVISFLSSHDSDTNVATETFTLGASLRRGAPRTTTSVLERSTGATKRDKVASFRDMQADVRDRSAEVSDKASDDHELAMGRPDGYGASRARGAAKEARTCAADDRQRADSDRKLAAEDRAQAALDLVNAQTFLVALMQR
ncbi:MAG: hypothetical protein QOI31_3029 [Solirubrobacterales bacterium]|jgi:hypothetical protein|nr:hypothetical protein [Solirubrobacterales bacterium]